MKHLGTKTIETERLLLRPFRPEDAGAMYRNWASSEAVCRFLTWPPHADVHVTEQILAEWCASYKDPASYQWAIVWKENGEPIGSIAAVETDDQTASASVGYCIGQDFWGKGITAEALKAVVAFFFEEVGVHSVRAYHAPGNPRSGRVMRKAGMFLEGTRRAAGITNRGTPCDQVWYSLLREEYFRQKEHPDTAIWEALHARAMAVLNARSVSPFVDAGSVAAALLTRSGNIYVGVCMDTACSLGMCAERSAVASMLTHGESQIAKIVAVSADGKAVAPCGACRELLMQLDRDSKDMEVLLDSDSWRAVPLKELAPDWWGAKRFEAAETSDSNSSAQGCAQAARTVRT